MKKLLTSLGLAAFAWLGASTALAVNTPADKFTYNPTTKQAADMLSFPAGWLTVGGSAVGAAPSVNFYASITAVTGGTASCLDGQNTSGTNNLLLFVTAGNVVREFEEEPRAGQTIDGVSIIQPANYNSSTNDRVFADVFANINAVITPIHGAYSGITTTPLTDSEIAVETGSLGNGTTTYRMLRIGDGALVGGIPVGVFEIGDSYTGTVAPGALMAYPFAGAYNNGTDGSQTFVYPTTAAGVGAIDLQKLRTVATNIASAFGSTIVGGQDNSVTGLYGTIVGGKRNQVVGYGSVGFGFLSYVSGLYSISDSSIVTGNYAAAFGNGSAGGNYSLAAGNGSFACGTDSVDLAANTAGAASVSAGTSSVSFGPGAYAAGAYDLAQGAGAGTGIDSTGRWTVSSYTGTPSVLTVSAFSDETDPTQEFSVGDSVLIYMAAGSSHVTPVATTVTAVSASGPTITVAASLAASTYVNAFIVNTGATQGRSAFSSAPSSTSAAEADAQEEKVIVKNRTTSATSTRLTVTGSADALGNRIRLSPGKTFGCTFTLIGRNVTTGDSLMAVRRAVFKESNTGTVALTGSVQTIGTDIYDSGTSWGSGTEANVVSITADTPNKAINVSVVGATATIDWACVVIMSEVYGFD